MCGIAGIFAYAEGAPQVDAGELMRTRDRMALRGPDSSGLWSSDDGRLGLAHRRLAILDLSDRGLQPMQSDCGRYRIIFNGEIYNYRELRQELARAGGVFRSDSDTEVLLHLYRRDREALCTRLRGMFAFAIWDAQQQELFLARDTFGIKPLYWHDDGKTLRFASQVKALLAGGAVANRPEAAGAAGFLIWGHVPEPWTTVKGVTSLPAGHWMRVTRGGTRTTHEYESVSALMGGEALDVEEGELTTLREAALDTVRHHLVSDVPVGVFLSAGIDSTSIAALAAEVGATLRTVTLGFEEYRGTARDETPCAEMVARHYGAQHRTIWLGGRDFVDELPRLLDHMDQPTTDGVNTYFVSKAATMAGLKVALSGLGGDELFGGYPSFAQIPRAVRRLGWATRAPALGRVFRWALRPVPDTWMSPKAGGLLTYGGTYPGAYLLRRAMRLPEEAVRAAFPSIDPATMRTGLERLALQQNLQATIRGITAPHDRVSALETCFYMRSQLLRDADWASMAHSLELRVPLVDRALTGHVVALRRAGRTPRKMDLALTPARPLPTPVVARSKTGFSLPVREWLIGAGMDTPNAERGLRGWQRFVWDAFATRAA